MQIISIDDLLNNPDAVLDRVDAGRRIFVRRGERLYAIIPVADNDLADDADDRSNDGVGCKISL